MMPAQLIRVSLLLCLSIISYAFAERRTSFGIMSIQAWILYYRSNMAYQAMDNLSKA